MAYLLVGLTYLYVGVLIFAAFPSPPLSKDCIEPVRLKNIQETLRHETILVSSDKSTIIHAIILCHPSPILQPNNPFAEKVFNEACDCSCSPAHQNFLDNFSSGDVMVFVARSFLLFQMITVYPLLGYLVRVQMMGQMFGNHYPR